MKNNFLGFYRKTLSNLLLGTAIFSAANTYAEVSQNPLSLTVGVPPNLIFTLDESGSMSWGFVPDAIESQVISGSTMTRLYAAPEFNSMYYNPNIKYIIPTSFDEAGNEVQLTTQFKKAPINGFRPEDGNLDLSNFYKATGKEYRMPTGAHNRLNNPSADFSVSISLAANGSTTKSSAAGISFKVTRSGTSKKPVYECTIEQTGPVLNNNDFNCKANGDTYTAETPAFYYIYDNSLNKCDNKSGTESCYKIVFVGDSEKDNFATWYSFYRTRALATLSATSLAFANLSPDVRLTWQNLALCTGLNGGDKAACKDNKFRQYDQLQKGQFYSWLKNVYFNSGTPLPAAMKSAGEFLKTDTAWLKYPNPRDNGKINNTANTYACRPSYHILMTDGMWNATTAMPGNLRDDNGSFTLPDKKVYSKAHPYQDSTDNTLADLAMHYWATDLNTGLDNKLSPYTPFKNGTPTSDYEDPRNNPATWQHMTNFIMGLGLTNSMSISGLPWEGSTFQGSGYDALKSGSKSWPEAKSGSSNNVYDLWHAAINSRGEFFSVDSPEAMVQAFSDILSRIADRKSTAAKPAINSGQVSEDENDAGVIKTVSYQTSYASDDNWSGDVKRFDKKLNSQTNTFESTEIWSAKSKVPGWQARTIMIAGDGTGSNLVNFSWNKAGVSSTAGTLANLLNKDPENGNAKDTKGEARLEYLRGNRTGEGKTYRQRSSVLGDFYSSSPAVVSGPRYLVNFSNALEGNTAYSTFATSIAARSPRVYVGGNDGMLHGFNAKTGVEEFAFIPSAVFPKLNKLTGTNYSHEYYVEGSPTVADVYDGTAWRTILVGTLKAGGKSVFALDITTPGSEKLLWEFDDSKLTLKDDTVKMGYSFSQPTIARLHSGKWAVVFGNGYESAGNTNGKAALFIVDAVTGALAKTLQVQGTDTVSNGLSTPKLGDFNADGVADYAYAGDLQGNMWRFNLMRDRSGASLVAPFKRDDDGDAALAEFKVSYSGKPLFRALATNGTSRQAITSAPSLVRHPTGVGYLVIFGTGKFYETGDKDGDKSMAQTVYGIWDEETLGYNGSAPDISRSNLQVQTVTGTISVTNGTDTRQGRLISSNDIRWKAAGGKPKQNGWYLNLVQADGEMVVENMAQLGRTVFFQSLVPNDDPCGDGTSNWTYAINPFTGGRTPQNAFDYKPSTDIGSTNVSAIRQDGEGGTTISQNSDGKFQLCTGQECANVYPDPLSLGRQSWRRIEETE